MNIQEIKNVHEEVMRPPFSARIAMLLLLAGLGIIALYFAVSLGVAATTSDYFSSSKAVRDSAVSGSTVLGNLAKIRSMNAWLEPLKFLGLSFMIFSIAISFGISIMKTLKLRMQIVGEFLEEITKH